MPSIYRVPYLLDFDHDRKNVKGQPALKMGRGRAGWTTADFDNRAEAEEFADSVPLASRVPNHGVAEVGNDGALGAMGTAGDKIVAYAERESFDPITGAPGILRDEWRVRKVADFSPKELEAAWGPDWQRYKPYATHVLEHRYIRRGVEEPWTPFQSANSLEQALGDVDARAIPVHPSLIKIQEKHRKHQEEEQAAKEVQKAKRAEAEERAYHAGRSSEAFKKLLAGKDSLVGQQWNEWMQTHMDRKAELANDPEFMRLYEAAMAAETVPAKRAAIKAFLKDAKRFGFYGQEDDQTMGDYGRDPLGGLALAVEKGGKYLTYHGGRWRFSTPDVAHRFDSRAGAQAMAEEHDGRVVPMPYWNAKARRYETPEPFADYAPEVERIAASFGAEVAAARKKLRSTGACVDDVFPELEHLKIKMCVTRASGEAGPRIVNDQSVVEALEKTVPEIFLDIREHIILLILDQKHVVVGVHKVALGSVSEAISDPRAFFGPALVMSASAVVLVHNHPSGDTTPSANDVALTKRLAEGGRILMVKLLDSVVVGTTQAGAHVHYSFMANGQMPGFPQG